MTSVADPRAEIVQLAPQGSPEFNEWLWEKLCELGNDVATVLEGDLIALVLGGGYGRGQGCTIFAAGRERPYNDVDLFLITRISPPKNIAQLGPLAREYEERLGISVDFSRPQTVPMIRNWPCLLMWQELVMGHKVLYGPEDIIESNTREVVRKPLPAVEASRLLLNRGAGLLWAERVLEGLEPSPDPTFVSRNYFKCVLGIADSLLIANARYTSDPEDKLYRILNLAARDSFVKRIGADELMVAGLEFRRSSEKSYEIRMEDCRLLAGLWMETFLWVESKRFGRAFSGVEDYVDWQGRRESHDPGVLRRLAANAKRGRLSWKHPREKVYLSLPTALSAMQNQSGEFMRVSDDALQAWRLSQ